MKFSFPGATIFRHSFAKNGHDMGFILITINLSPIDSDIKLYGRTQKSCRAINQGDCHSGEKYYF
jgi:hypothetical protein